VKNTQQFASCYDCPPRDVHTDYAYGGRVVDALAYDQ